MATTTLFRLAALGLVVGAVLCVVSSFLVPGALTRAVVNGTPFFTGTIIGMVGVSFLVWSLWGFYLRQRERSGVLGLLGTLMIIAGGGTLIFGFNLVTVLVLPWLAHQSISNSAFNSGPPSFGGFFIVTSILVGLGEVVLGVATIMGKVYSLPLGVGLIVAGVLGFGVGFANLPGS